MLHFFKDSSGAALQPTNIEISDYDQLVASAITLQNAKDKSTYLRIKVITIVQFLCFNNQKSSKYEIKEKQEWARTLAIEILLQVVNFGNRAVDLNISVVGLANGIKMSGSKQTVLTSSNPLDENSFEQPEKVGRFTE